MSNLEVQKVGISDSRLKGTSNNYQFVTPAQAGVQ